MDRMSDEFKGPRTAIVTGGARRIGAELCRYLAGAGWHVLIHCLHSRDEADRQVFDVLITRSSGFSLYGDPAVL